MSDEEQKLRVRHVGRDGRRRYDPGSKARLVAACLEPGVSISGLALTHGINANLLRKWVKEAPGGISTIGVYPGRGSRRQPACRDLLAGYVGHV